MGAFPLTLEVHHGGTTFTYEAHAIENEEGRSISSEWNEAIIEMADVQLMLGAGRDGSFTFLGASTIFDVPDDEGLGWRARLLLAHSSGTIELLDGLIWRTQIRFSPIMDRWIVRLVDGAAEQFLQRLETVDGTSAGEKRELIPGSFLTVPTWEVKESGERAVEDRKWYDLRGLWEANLAALPDVSVTYQYDDPQYAERKWFELDVWYSGGGGDLRIRRDLPVYTCAPETSSNLPGVGKKDEQPEKLWNVRQLYDALSAMLGWRLRASYAPFPSRDIEAHILTDRWLSATSPLPPDLDDLVTEGQYEYGFEEPMSPDFALRYGNKVGEWPLYVTVQQGSPIVFPPEPEAIYAAERYEIDEEGDAANASVVQIPFHLPHIAEPVRQDLSHQPDPAGHPGYTELVRYSQPIVSARGTIYVGAFDAEPLTGKLMMVVHREPGGPTSAQSPRINEAWCFNLYSNHQLKRARWYLLDGEFDLEDLISDPPRVGDQYKSVRFASKQWIVRREDRRTGDAVTGYVLYHPAVVSELVYGGPAPVDLFPPENLAGECVCDPATEDLEVTLTWGAPSVGDSPDGYEIEEWPADSTLGWRFPITTAQTAYVTVYEDGAPGVYRFRIRSKKAGATSSWAFVNVYCQDCSDTGVPPPGEGATGCYETRGFLSGWSPGNQERVVTLDFGFAYPLSDNNQSYRYNIAVVGDPAPATNFFVKERYETSFLLRADQPVGNFLQISGTVDRWIKENPLCTPCWKTNTWYGGTFNACAPFAPLPVLLDGSPSAGVISELRDEMNFRSTIHGGNIYCGWGGAHAETNNYHRKHRVFRYIYPDGQGGGNTWVELAEHPWGHSPNYCSWGAMNQGKYWCSKAPHPTNDPPDAWSATHPDSDRLWSQDLLTGNWTNHGPLPHVEFDLQSRWGWNAFMFAYGTGVAMAGGINWGNKVIYYNGASWSELPGWPIPDGWSTNVRWQWPGIGYGPDGVYFFGGFKTDIAQGITEPATKVWKLSTGVWSEQASLPEARIYPMIGYDPTEGYFHVVGGAFSTSVTGSRTQRTTNWRYSPTIGVSSPYTLATQGGNSSDLLYVDRLFYRPGAGALTNAMDLTLRVYVLYHGIGVLNPFTGEPAA